MAQPEQGKADLRCNSCGHQFRGWVWYSQMSRNDPGPRRWYPGVPIGDCPEATPRHSASSVPKRWTTPRRTRTRPPETRLLLPDSPRRRGAGTAHLLPYRVWGRGVQKELP